MDNSKNEDKKEFKNTNIDTNPYSCFTKEYMGRKFLHQPLWNIALSKHKHALDYYIIWSRLGLIPTIHSSVATPPDNYEHPYSDFPLYLSKEYIYKKSYSKEGNSVTTQILQVIDKNNEIKYMIKRRIFIAPQEAQVNEIESKKENFKRRSFEEYLYCKLYSLCPYGVETRGYNFIFLDAQKTIASEFLMDYVDDDKTYRDKFLPHNTHAFHEFFIHLVTAQFLMEGQNLYHLDIKPDNILFKQIKFNNNGSIIDIPIVLDFDIGKLRSKTENGSGSTNIYGFTPGFASPEQIKIKKLGLKGTFFSPWVSQIYSIGLVMCKIMEIETINDYTRSKNFKHDVEANSDDVKKRTQGVIDDLIACTSNDALKKKYII